VKDKVLGDDYEGLISILMPGVLRAFLVFLIPRFAPNDLSEVIFELKIVEKNHYSCSRQRMPVPKFISFAVRYVYSGFTDGHREKQKLELPHLIFYKYVSPVLWFYSRMIYYLVEAITYFL
jgi:hypothetical protein